MFIVRIDLKIAEAARAAFRDYARSGGRDAYALPGCRDYSFCEDLADPTRVLLYEEWATREHFEAYRASTIFEAIGARLRPMLAAPPKSAYYESDDVFASCAVR